MLFYPRNAGIQTLESERLAVLQATRLIESQPSTHLANLVRAASEYFDAPITLVSLLDSDRQWLKGCIGMAVSDFPRSVSFCDFTMRSAKTVVIEDALTDVEVMNHPLVVEDPKIRFYAGTPLVNESNFLIGTFCIASTQPRKFTQVDVEALVNFSKLAMALLELQMGVGRRNAVTNLPNRTQLAEDLADLCEINKNATRSLILLETMHASELLRSVRAIGVAPIEKVLLNFSSQLSIRVRDAGRVYHVSETRFAVLLDDSLLFDHLENGEAIVHDMRKAFDSDGISVALNVCAGAVSFNLVDLEVKDALRCAIAALHRAEQGESLISWHEPDLDEEHKRTFILLRDFPIHLAQRHIRLVYQPKYDIGRGRYASVEALVRWDHPDLGAISPGFFVPLIEGTLSIHLLTKWVMETAFQQQADWKKKGLELSVAVNVSARNLENGKFIEDFQGACHSAGLLPSEIHVECTETSMILSAKAVATLRTLAALGVHIALDDFGTGYSNLAALQNLPARLIKIDQSLVFPIVSDALALRLFRSIVVMTKSLGYRVLAEGVESSQMLDIVIASGCDGAQGYYLSRPLEVAAVEKFIINKKDLVY